VEFNQRKLLKCEMIISPKGDLEGRVIRNPEGVPEHKSREEVEDHLAYKRLEEKGVGGF
jgi:hypothetical protein